MNLIDSSYNTLLHKAVFQDNMRDVELLVKSKASVTQLNKNGVSPIHLAAMMGHYEVLFKMLSQQNISLTTNRNQTVLHLLAQSHDSTASVFLRVVQQFDVSRIVSLQDADGFTFLHLSIKQSGF